MNRKTAILAAPATLALALAACAEPVDQDAERYSDGADMEMATTDGEAALMADAHRSGRVSPIWNSARRSSGRRVPK